MSEWFRSVPQSLDTVAYATRVCLGSRPSPASITSCTNDVAQFQMETLAALARHYKNKYIQQRSLIDRLKNEFKTLKKYPFVYTACARPSCVVPQGSGRPQV